MDDRAWMYNGWRSFGDIDPEWMRKSRAFVETAFQNAGGASKVWCPCKKCGNQKRQSKEDMSKHLPRNGWTEGYKRWIFHGETERMRDEVVRQRINDLASDAGVGDMIDDFHAGNFGQGLEDDVVEEPEGTAKAYYDMLEAAQKPLHSYVDVSRLDAISRLMDLKARCNMSRDGFDDMLSVIETLMPRGHDLPKNMYESNKLLAVLKITYEQIHACKNGCVLFRKDYKDDTHCPKCKSSRYIEVDSGDGQKRHLGIPVKILRYLPFVPRLQRMYMTEESAKQMTWHKDGRRYTPDKMVHPSDAMCHCELVNL